MTTNKGATEPRCAAANLDSEEFRRAGHALVDAIAEFYASLPARPITRADSPQIIRDLLGDSPLPAEGTAAEALLQEITPLAFEHSLHNGHPRFLGYITSSAAPLGALADLLAASINSNVGKWDLSPLASEIEAQTIRWLAELVGFPPGGSGLLSSGGNMANMIGFFAARTAQAQHVVRRSGLRATERQLIAYGSGETHTWIEKAADVSGIGTDAIRWIDTDASQRINVAALEQQIARDKAEGHLPFLVVGTAGNVSTGAVDALTELANICRRENLWFHVDGAYGAPAAALPDAADDLKRLHWPIR